MKNTNFIQITSMVLYINNNIKTNRLPIVVLFSIYGVLSNVCLFGMIVLKLILKKNVFVL